MKEALKLALEAADGLKDVTRRVNELIAENKALKAALAQQNDHSEQHLDMVKAQPAQQEPVAWMDIDEKGGASGLRYWSEPDNRHEVALYTTPPQRTWVGLTEARAKEIWLKGKDHGDDWLDVLALARVFEAELKELNT